MPPCSRCSPCPPDARDPACAPRGAAPDRRKPNPLKDCRVRHPQARIKTAPAMDSAPGRHYTHPSPRGFGLADAQVAQLVEHATENRSVGGSIPPLGTICSFQSVLRSFKFIQNQRLEPLLRGRDVSRRAVASHRFAGMYVGIGRVPTKEMPTCRSPTSRFATSSRRTSLTNYSTAAACMCWSVRTAAVFGAWPIGSPASRSSFPSGLIPPRRWPMRASSAMKPRSSCSTARTRPPFASSIKWRHPQIARRAR